MNSDYIKVVLSHNCRFNKQCHYVATECGLFNSDFLAIKNNLLCEFEIKTSKADLMADFKKRKHRVYSLANSYWTPNEFYFVVPQNIVEYAVSKCVGKKYGVIVVMGKIGKIKIRKTSTTYGLALKKYNQILKNNPEAELVGIRRISNYYETCIRLEDHIPLGNRLRIIKRAKKLHTRVVDHRVLSSIVARLSSEMASLRLSEHIMKEKLSVMEDTIKAIQNSDN